MLKISAPEVEFSSEVSAKMLSFLKKGAALLSPHAGKLNACRGCAVSALLDPAVLDALTSPTLVAIGADGAKIGTEGDLVAAVELHQVGEKIALRVRRGEGGAEEDVKELDVVVTLEPAR